MKQGLTGMKILTVTSFLAMVFINALANILPINGVKTAQVSDSYPNLFVPAGITFSIWGLIYFLLALYVLYELGLFRGRNKPYMLKRQKEKALNKVGILFSISSIVNAGWIFAWHYYYIFLSLILMAVILICLILIHQELKEEQLTKREKFLIRFPFSVYFGWITVATIANVTAFLVSRGWNGFGLPEPLWTIIIIGVSLVISALTMLKNQDEVYGLVIIWTYIGIIAKHLSENGFNAQYHSVILASAVSIAILLVVEVYVYLSKPIWDTI